MCSVQLQNIIERILACKEQCVCVLKLANSYAYGRGHWDSHIYGHLEMS